MTSEAAMCWLSEFCTCHKASWVLVASIYFIPATGTPKKLVHRIESDALDHLPGDKVIYLRWQELEAAVQSIVAGHRNVAMEYSPRNGNPYISRVDAGTVELVRSFGC